MGLGERAPEWDEYDWYPASPAAPPARRTRGAGTRPSGRPEASTAPTHQAPTHEAPAPAATASPGAAGAAPTDLAGQGVASLVVEEPVVEELGIDVQGLDGQSLEDALAQWLADDPGWAAHPGARLLLVDLDNLRAGRVRWQARIDALVALAERFDHVVLAGQHDAVRRARPHLGRYEAATHGVDDGSDLADHILLGAATALHDRDLHVVVVSNDNIFAQLAARWPVSVISPDYQALSDQLRTAAGRIVDLASLERDLAAAPRRTSRRATTGRTRKGAPGRA